MPINVFEEKMISLNEARKLLPKNRGSNSLSLATFYRWIQKGVRAKNGNRVQLEVVKIGGSTFTSQEALQRFVDGLSATTEDAESTQDQTTRFGIQHRPRTPLQEKRHQEWVNERLDELLGVRKCSLCKCKLAYSNKAIPKKEKLYCVQCLVKLPNITIGQRLRVFRWDANVSQNELSGRTGLQVEEIRAFEHDEKSPTNTDFHQQGPSLAFLICS